MKKSKLEGVRGRHYVTGHDFDIGIMYCYLGGPCSILLPDKRRLTRNQSEVSLLKPQVPPELWKISAMDVYGKSVKVGSIIYAVQGDYAKQTGIVCGLTLSYAFMKIKRSTGKTIVPVRITDIYRCDNKPVPALLSVGIPLVRKSGRVLKMDPIPEESDAEGDANAEDDAAASGAVKEATSSNN